MQNAKRKAQIPARRSALVLLAAIFAALIATNTPVAEASVHVPANRLWADGVVPFEWDANLSFNNRLRVLAAMNISRCV